MKVIVKNARLSFNDIFTPKSVNNGKPAFSATAICLDGDEEGIVDIGDLTALIAYLFIPPNPVPGDCQ